MKIDNPEQRIEIENDNTGKILLGGYTQTWRRS